MEQCDSKNRECVEDENGAHCGGCKPHFIEENGECRAVKTCEDLGCADQHRQCTPATDTTDASCGDCIDEYIEKNGECVAPPLNCKPDSNFSILAQCNEQHRKCVQPDPQQDATCGECLDGYGENDQGKCQKPQSCEDLQCYNKGRRCLGDPPYQYCGSCLEGLIPSPTNPDECIKPLTCKDITCEADQFCIEGGPGEHAKCESPKCPAGQAWGGKGAGKHCVTCYANCSSDHPGETGRIWLYTLKNSDECICETKDGWYWDEGDRLAKQCDADHDGWVRMSARSFIESDDPALRANARCNLHVIDRFVLENEYKQQLTIYLCKGDPMFKREGQGMCDKVNPLPLYESVRNDDQKELNKAVDLPAYAVNGNGRKPRAKELNGLTKMCTIGGDYNDNGVSDISEWHEMPQGNMTAEQYVMAHFSYYIELYKGHYEPIPGKPYGKYVIQERNRCGDQVEFPLKYADTDGPYWRSCTRGRDTEYDPSDGPQHPDFNTDFEEWDCDNPKGGCLIPPPPTSEKPQGDHIPVHGLCEVQDKLPPTDAQCNDQNIQSNPGWFCVNNGIWRGMNHGSQFKCVVISPEPSTKQPVISPDDITNGKYRFNQCHVDCPENDPNCAADCTDNDCAQSSIPVAGQSNPYTPKLKCEVVAAPTTGMAGFVAVSWRSTPPYKNGCINEWTPDSVHGNTNGSDDEVVSAWRSLCPGWKEFPDVAKGQGDQTNFGKLQCGCGNNYGGVGCKTGCPDPDLHLSPTYKVSPRKGFWMCGSVVSTAYTNKALHGEFLEGELFTGKGPDGSNWSISGSIRPITDGTALCENNDCNSGWAIKP